MGESRLQRQKLQNTQLSQVITKTLTTKPFVRKYSSISKYVPPKFMSLKKSKLKISIAVFIYNILKQEGALTEGKMEKSGIVHKTLNHGKQEITCR